MEKRLVVVQLVTPLKKKTLNGKRYARPIEIERKLTDLEELDLNEIVGRIYLKEKDPSYIPSECLVYFLRNNWDDGSSREFEQLYSGLMERILRTLPKEIREEVIDQFNELLCMASDKLDFFEIRFNRSLVNLRRDVQRRIYPEKNLHAPLEFVDGTGEPNEEVEIAARNFGLLSISEINDPVFRLAFDSAISKLPFEQRVIFHLIDSGIPIDSNDESVETISKLLKKSEKTIRNHRDKGRIALLRDLEGDLK